MPISLARTLSLAFLLAVTTASAQDRSFLVGTTKVSFQPLHSANEKYGCSLAYMSAALDFATLKGLPVMVVGNIFFSVNRAQKAPGLSLKIAVSDYESPDPKPFAPHFAYLQSANGSTLKSKFQELPADEEGFKIFVFALDGQSTKLLGDLLDGQQPINVGFRRKQGGMDVLVPVDLTVASTELKDGKLLRTKSDAAITNFRKCFSDVAKLLN